ncbi:urate hydroxylase PuuD [Horticoccus sp. 23ND18S-11]|uniref:urate hydroxylase PuuD n=1 Tax=Horticoccus sp. 23ND18S-11 TaxID=3391832 RepID=UPI0039C92F3B
MDAHLVEFLSLLLRWLHIIAGIAWIGSSFYFIWLDNSLEPPAPGSENAKKGVSGELWAVHGGGFYNPQKYAVAPASLPEKLHWFKWEAYTTWLSGTALLVVLYWVRAQSMMLDRGLVTLTNAQAIGIAAASMVGAWFIYDALCRSPLGKREVLLGVIVFALLGALSFGLHQVFSGRAAYIHVGTAIGTIMAANVFFVIIPGQRKMVEAMRVGQLPDPIYGQRGKQRSVHNNYFTLPVLFIMISNHYASTYGHRHAWVILMLMIAAGVSIRHFFNRRHKGVLAWQYPMIGGLLLATVAWWTAPRIVPLPKVEGAVTLERVRAIMGERCINCHSPVPTFPGLAQPPLGVELHTADALVKNAQRVYQQVVVTRMMPLGNITQMTEQERAVVAAWVAAGSPLK